MSAAFSLITSVEKLFATFADGVFDVSDGLVRGAFGFIEFAFGLELLVAGDLTGGVLDGAFS